MHSIDLEAAVTQAVNTSWPEFERAHPALAAILDRQLLVEEAQKQIQRDPAWQQAMAQAGECSSGEGILLGLIEPLVASLFARLTAL